jgi:hypothetical protein
MTTNPKVLKALDVRRLKLPPGGPRIVDIEVEDYVDHSRDDSLRIWVLLPDDLDEKQITGRWVIDLNSAIHDSLLAQGIDLFPYVSIATVSERREATAEE